MTIAGIDVSSWQPNTNWDAVAVLGVQFAVIKATESNGYVNPAFARDWSEAKRVGLVRGAYHYCRPDFNQPELEAAYFLATVGALEPGDFLACDMEAGNGDLLDWTLRWLRTVETAVGFKPFLYSGLWFMQPHGLTGSPELAQYGLWYASYQAAQPPTPPAWPFTAIWQHSASGYVFGVSGDCDLDTFFGTADQLRAYGKPQPVEPPVRVPTNDDLVAAGKLLLNADIAGTLAYLAPFTGAAHAIEPAAAVRPKRIIPPVRLPDADVQQ